MAAVGSIDTVKLHLCELCKLTFRLMTLTQKGLDMLRLAILAAVLLTFSFNVCAQRKATGGFGYFSIGGAVLVYSAINDALSPGIGKQEQPAFITGGGGMLVLKNFMIGGQGWGGSTPDSQGDTLTTAIDLSGGEFLLGYMFSLGKGNNLYPTIGIGGIGTTLTTFPTGGRRFDQVLRSPQVFTQSFYHRTLLLRPSLNYQKFFSAKQVYGGGLFIGLRAGYLYGVSTNDWKMDRLQLTGAPDYSPSGPTFELTIGLGGLTNTARDKSEEQNREIEDEFFSE